jgi:hypothetical protein
MKHAEEKGQKAKLDDGESMKELDVDFCRKAQPKTVPDEFICCQDCGRIIYWDKGMKEPVTSLDDMSAPPYVTESGDLFCSICGPAYDEPDEDGGEYDGEEYGE